MDFNQADEMFRHLKTRFEAGGSTTWLAAGRSWFTRPGGAPPASSTRWRPGWLEALWRREMRKLGVPR